MSNIKKTISCCVMCLGMVLSGLTRVEADGANIDQKEGVLAFNKKMSYYDKYSNDQINNVISPAGKPNRGNVIQAYSQGKQAVENLRVAMLAVSQEKVPEGLPEEAIKHLEKAKESMGLVIYNRKHAMETFLEYLDDPKPSIAAKIQEYDVSPSQLNTAIEMTQAGAIVGLSPNDLFPVKSTQKKSKKKH